MERALPSLRLRVFRAGLARDTLTIFGVRILFLGISFVIGVILARVLGAEGFGNYALALAWTGFLAVLATLGLPELITREVPARAEKEDWGTLRGLLVWSDVAIFVASSALALLAIGLAWIFLSDRNPALFWATTFAFASLPAYGLVRSSTATIQGLRAPVASQLPELVVRPAVFLVLILVLVLSRGAVMTGALATALFALSRLVGLGTSFVLLGRLRPAELAAARPAFRGHRWLRTALPFLAISSIFVVSAHTDAIMLGAIRGAEAVGIYSVANQGAQLILLALMASHVVVLPEVSRLFTKRDIAGLQQVVTRSARLVSAVGLATAAVLVIFGPWFLLVFGPEFTVGYRALILLSVAQSVNAVTGLAGPVLSMTGFERTTAVGFGIGAVTNVALNALLIPLAGVDGAAVATALSVVVQNVVLAVWVRRRLGVNSLPFGSSPAAAARRRGNQE